VKRISGLIYEETRGVLKIFLENVIRDSVTYTEHAKRYVVSSILTYLFSRAHYVLRPAARPSPPSTSSTPSSGPAAPCTVSVHDFFIWGGVSDHTFLAHCLADPQILLACTDHPLTHAACISCISLYTYPILYASLMPIHDIIPYIAPPWLASLVLPTVVVDVPAHFLYSPLP
jgi:hypothetical protein